MIDRLHSPPAQQRSRILLMVLLNAYATPLMLSATNVALPSMAEELGLDAVALGWVPTAYLMASAMFVLIFGRVADLSGRKRVFLLGTAAVILSSLLGAAADSAAVLLGARFLQGLSSAMLYATQVALVASVFPPGERGRAIGFTVAAVYAGLASGPLLGGVAIDTFGWRASFLLQIPIAIVVLGIGLSTPGDTTPPRPGRFDWAGAFAYAGGLLLVCLGVSLLPALMSLPALLAGAFAIAWFFRHARRASDPLLDVRLFFSNRLFTLSSTAALIMYAATYANVVLVSLYLQYLKGMSPSQAGLFMMVQPLAMALLSPLSGQLSDRLEPRLLASSGMALTALGLVVLANLDPGSAPVAIVAALGLTGVGFSLFSSPNVNAIMGSVEARLHGSASAAVAITRIIGQLLSMVLVTLALALLLGDEAIGPGNLDRLESAITLSFSLAALICLPGIGLSLLRGRAHPAPEPRPHG